MLSNGLRVGPPVGFALLVLVAIAGALASGSSSRTPAQRSFGAVADAVVSAARPRANVGRLRTLRVDAAPVERSYLRFRVRGLRAPVATARLQLYALTGSRRGLRVHGVAGTDWREGTITYAAAPALSGVRGTSGAFRARTWRSIDVTALVRGNGSVSMALTTTASRGIVLASREAPSHRPRLIVETEAGEAVVVAAGDIACDPGSSSFNRGLGTSSACREKYTADLVERIGAIAVLNLGDAQYERGTLSRFAASYDRSWGAFKAKTWAVAGGIHDFYGGGDWYAYFGRRAGPAPYTPYSLELAGWHVIVLNSQCSQARVGGCGRGSRQYAWLQADLTAHPARCTLALWHNARWSSGSRHGTDDRTDAFIRALYSAGADVVLSAHDHLYERFAPQNPDAGRDDARGLVQFVVGTGGKSLDSFGRIAPNSEARSSSAYGVLKLTLRPTGYDWQFVPEARASFTDSGSARCH
ncbi:MAG TPA: DNRLRE domain-containing protein [Gaiellaceae bacterium]|nr:DNRLRE domain-containing protein [Gaiellaceae bacterium]